MARPSAVSEVFIYRIPAEEAGREGPEHRILRGSDARRGFIDTDASRGQRYIYRVRCAVTVGGVMRLSEATEATVEVCGAGAGDRPVAGRPSPDGSLFELTWTPPPAGLVIYAVRPGPTPAQRPLNCPKPRSSRPGSSRTSG